MGYRVQLCVGTEDRRPDLHVSAANALPSEPSPNP